MMKALLKEKRKAKLNSSTATRTPSTNTTYNSNNVYSTRNTEESPTERKNPDRLYRSLRYWENVEIQRDTLVMLINRLADDHPDRQQAIENLYEFDGLYKIDLFCSSFNDTVFATNEELLHMDFFTLEFVNCAIEANLPFIHEEADTLLELDILEEKSLADMQRLNELEKGIEVLKLFCLDLIGRKSPEAAIFRLKLNEEFQPIKEVDLLVKVLSVVILLVSHSFFVYYIVLSVFVEGERWQHIYISTAITAILLEVLFFQTICVLWYHVVVPLLFRSRWRRLKEAFEWMLAKLQKNYETLQRASRTDRTILNAMLFDPTEYFFLSKRVAARRPSLPESTLLQCFQGDYLLNFLPSGEHLRDESEQQKNTFPSSMGEFLRKLFVVLTVGNPLFMFVVTLFYSYQKAILDILQPMIVTGGTLTIYLIVSNLNNILIVIGALVFCLLALAAYFYHLWLTKKSESNTSEWQPRSDIRKKPWRWQPSNEETPRCYFSNYVIITRILNTKKMTKARKRIQREMMREARILRSKRKSRSHFLAPLHALIRHFPRRHHPRPCDTVEYILI
jgi:hypothetical protein